ncbi:hypothetical protein DFH27DRAFT_553945 [Peziza echinospora]|nr:hypothetical protein DFH27DRAFT_553945 [Peziza echinospora]
MSNMCYRLFALCFNGIRCLCFAHVSNGNGAPKHVKSCRVDRQTWYWKWDMIKRWPHKSNAFVFLLYDVATESGYTLHVSPANRNRTQAR